MNAANIYKNVALGCRDKAHKARIEQAILVLMETLKISRKRAQVIVLSNL